MEVASKSRRALGRKKARRSVFARWALGGQPNASVLVPPHALLRALREVPDLPDELDREEL